MDWLPIIGIKNTDRIRCKQTTEFGWVDCALFPWPLENFVWNSGVCILIVMEPWRHSCVYWFMLLNRPCIDIICAVNEWSIVSTWVEYDFDDLLIRNVMVAMEHGTWERERLSIFPFVLFLFSFVNCVWLEELYPLYCHVLVLFFGFIIHNFLRHLWSMVHTNGMKYKDCSGQLLGLY